MAADLGVSDQTVARRYQQLRRRAGVRVIALAQPKVDNSRDVPARRRLAARTTLASRESAIANMTTAVMAPACSIALDRRSFCHPGVIRRPLSNR